MRSSASRREFLQVTSAAAAGAMFAGVGTSSQSLAQQAAASPNERLRIGCIGTGDRWKAVVSQAKQFGDVIAVCDVDANHMAEGRKMMLDAQSKSGREYTVDAYEDYRQILDRKDIDVVTIVTPDHWHSKIAIEAMQAGKDIYCEKPLTLTINEGKQIVKVLDETKRVFQVGTQQRTEMNQRFIQAVAIIRAGRIGKIKKVTCDIGGAPTSGMIPTADVPAGLNWERWLGQAPLVDFRFKSTEGRWGNSRCHYEFRWWYEYSGGKMTDWGAHHVDIASWAMGMDKSGPLSLEGIAKHPVEFKGGLPTRDDQYNTATEFDVTVMCPNDVEMHIVSKSPDGNGILFEGTDGRFHVSRGSIKGGVIDALKDNPLPEDALEKVYGGKIPRMHFENFVESIKARKQPISDVHSHHRAMTTCHLANIAIRLGRKINWDSQKQMIVGDADAAQWMGREQRKGYEINVSV
ncbi:MAG: Gfo/Idh/MocA family oxidoreductase [Pirellulaceae bacterium]|nr:Gfo/Idh/MocA family oxidoreductase [Pirellulaceae bacterium]